MMYTKYWYTLLLATISPSTAYAQFGVCDRAANDAVYLVNFERQRKVNLVLQYNYPPTVIQAHLDIINYSHQDALNDISRGHYECARGFRSPQQIVNTAVTVFTMGLNRALPPGMVRIDISEAAAGRPFGGPNALVPRAREQVLRGDNSTPSNVVRDPWKCVTFQRKC